MEIYEEEQESRAIPGITDSITKQAVTGTNYPVVNVKLTSSIPKYKLEALSKLLKSDVKVSDTDENEEQLANVVYVALKSDAIYKPIGKIMPKQVKTLMSILVGLDVELETKPGVIMDSKYIYALSS